MSPDYLSHPNGTVPAPKISTGENVTAAQNGDPGPIMAVQLEMSA